MGIDAQERKALADAVREASASGPREFLDDGGRPTRDERLWKLLTDQMGLGALLVDEANGGAGAGVAEVAVVLEELAAALAVVPALTSLGSSTALLRLVDTEASSVVLQSLAAGDVTATVAWPHAESCDTATVLTASGDIAVGSSVTVNGHCDFVLDAGDAEVILAPVSIGEDVVIVSIDTAPAGFAAQPMTGLDLTRGLAAIDVTDATATVLGSTDLSVALDVALVLMAAEQVGVAQHCHGAAVTWARERVQFDRPIGQFQAIKHQLVDLLMHVEMARSALDVAVGAADRYFAVRDAASATALRVAASMAKARCGEAATIVADQSLHILGGIGFTWEHDAHLYLRRAKALEVLLGSPAAHRRRSATTLLEEAARG
ncbi:acyl-CoA/acyl-ACP dehydrogenase [Gordonia sp. zg691]|uniref:acyl-CoA dehydrogenase family protein n=1 Tax=Gordonia jinghuaiqii TaxID=2758710 RepID=UPI00166272EF|nr:acyl-CoA dehydrogenase family protein [Gordonia jinghuaiqii]MBD0859824.1 acyl-CoA/acyl-ACP dehydrogenase [Gordonia jinghuaiqii]